MAGWIKLHRNLAEWEWYDDQNTCRLFIHCLLKANHKDKKWKGMDIKKGSFYTSLDTLSDETGLTNRQIRTCLNKLKSTGEVSGLAMARGRMITICNYSTYQHGDRLSVDDVAGLRQGSDRVATATKNEKNEKNENNSCDNSKKPSDELEKKRVLKQARAELINNAFDFFWTEWRTKKNKPAARKAFDKLFKTKTTGEVEDLVNRMIQDIEQRTMANDFGFDKMHPATYLNGQRWEDEISGGQAND